MSVQEPTPAERMFPRTKAALREGITAAEQMDAEIKLLRVALSCIARQAARCRGEQSYRDTIAYVERTAMRALGKRGLER